MIYTRSRWDGPVTGEPRLTVGTAMSAPIKPEWVGHVPMVEAVAEAVRAAVGDAGIAAADAAYVLTKSHGVLPEDVAEAAARGVDLTLFDPSVAAQRLNGAAGLGVAVAVDGLPLPDDADIATDLTLWSGRASASGGREDRRTQVVLLGNSGSAGGHLRVGHSVMADLLDIDALPRALRGAGLEVAGPCLDEPTRRRIVAVYAKIGTPPGGRLRGRRQVHQGQNPSYLNELKAAVAGMFSAALQDTVLYITSAATHQGPPGGGTVAVVVDHAPGS
jgi:cyanuric acid amidohydrolase